MADSFHEKYLLQRVEETAHLRLDPGATFAYVPATPNGLDYFSQRVAESNARNAVNGRSATYAGQEWVGAFLEFADR